MTDEELVAMAIEAARRAYAPVSDFPVGAALLAEDGRVFTGCNVESPSLLHVVCAERVALLKAVSEGARDFETMAIHAPRRDDIAPCGLCRQMMVEFAPHLRVLLVRDADDWRETDIAALLPDAFRL
ncbi:MAG: cytidine deaminase [Deltaproteobacteria bacterium]|nr:cytidine deaminase [Deltaproteobacteria bacterium]